MVLSPTTTSMTLEARVLSITVDGNLISSEVLNPLTVRNVPLSVTKTALVGVHEDHDRMISLPGGDEILTSKLRKKLISGMILVKGVSATKQS